MRKTTNVVESGVAGAGSMLDKIPERFFSEFREYCRILNDEKHASLKTQIDEMQRLKPQIRTLIGQEKHTKSNREVADKFLSCSVEFLDVCHWLDENEEACVKVSENIEENQLKSDIRVVSLWSQFVETKQHEWEQSYKDFKVLARAYGWEDT